ncbi:MAG: hypothetical protein GY807_13060 [Gammaproteobacteria bacterium]|nr:hypothetical protein [Gammaproteobacteria bacterium]
MISLREQYGDTLPYKTFEAIHSAGINYCIWKSMDRFAEGVRGETDFDVLVAEISRDEVFNVLGRLGWIRLLAESWRRFPDIHDFVRYDPQYKRFLHFHLHFRLISGEMRIKNLEIPLRSLYLENMQHDGPIYWAMPELQLIVLCLRIADKTRGLDAVKGLIPLGPGLKTFKDEFIELRDVCNDPQLQTLLRQEQLAVAASETVERFFQDYSSYTRDARKSVRRSLKAWVRYRGFAYLRVYLERLIMRRIEGMGKRQYGQGITVAIVGGDGSGKSTLAREVRKRLSQHMQVEHIYLGGSPDSRGAARTVLRFTLFPLVTVLWRILSVGSHDLAHRVQRFYYSLEERLIVAEKIPRYRRGQGLRAGGGIVLYERFPLFPGYGDRGDDLGMEKLENYLEQKYRLFETPDLMVCLDVQPETAAARKPDHPETMVRDKATVFSAYFSSRSVQPDTLLLNAEESVDKLSGKVCERIAGVLAGDR